MVELTSRCLALAEGVVTMVCPVLLALAIKKINWKGKVEEPVVPMAMLLIASATLITGICPLLACCLSKIFQEGFERCHTVTRIVAAALSSACLLALAYFISLIILPRIFVATMGAFILGAIVASLGCLYCLADAPEEAERREEEEAERIEDEEAERIEREKEERRNEIHDILDRTHEFMCGVTGIVFLGLEGLALEGLISTCHGMPHAVRIPVLSSFILCAIGVFLMFFTMIYPVTVTTEKAKIVGQTICFDLFMAVGTVAILTIIMVQLMGHKGLLLFSSPFFILFYLVCRLVIRPGVAPRAQQEAKAAPLGLTKVTFTGFWAMSVTAISTGFPNEWTNFFLICAAAAIASGLFWRLLTHMHIQNDVMVDTANAASFCTHFSIAVATVLFTVMAWEAANKVQVNTCARGQ